jgi:hypothetical protein
VVEHTVQVVFTQQHKWYLTNVNGCDSTVTLNLTINNQTSGSESITACDSYFWSADGGTYSSSGVYTTTLTNANGCDSTVTLNLTINNQTSGSETITACDSYFWSADGGTYSSTGVYTTTLTNANGCDSTVTLNLTINNATSGSETITACDSYFWSADGLTYNSSGIFTTTLTNANGCDSTVTLNLTINNQTSGSENITACDSYFWSADGGTYSSSGVYTTTLTNVNGCDSTVTLNLTINNQTSGSETITACDSYFWSADGGTYSSSGIYTTTLTNSNGCDSLVTLNLTINNQTSGSETITACDSYFWSADGGTYSSSGVYTTTLTNANGCDSIVTLNLTINNQTSGSESITACDSYFWSADGGTYSSTGVYTTTLTNVNGCDSTVTLNLTINNQTSGPESITACDSYFWSADGGTYSSSGVYTTTLTNANGCDSIVTLNLTINNQTSGSESITACDSYFWSADGGTYSSSGIYTTTLTNVNGCDSTVTLNLTINNQTSGSETITACDSYFWSADGGTYSSSGVYTTTLTNANGCDSIVTLNLTINNPTSGSESITACDSYFWSADGGTYSSTGVYTTTLTNANGCDSTVTLNLTINNQTSGSESITACDSYFWSADGITYNSSGIFTTTLTNANGCDSIVTLNLTINNQTSGSETITACDSYFWSADGGTYSSSGIYTTTLTNSNGCDSTVTLNLTINNPTSGSETITACDSYFWSADGGTYSSSGVYTTTLTNANGCDSTVTLNLTINNATSGSETITACDSYFWSIDGLTYNSSGIYTTTLTNANGCDSIVTLNLTINNEINTNLNVTACGQYVLNNETYTSSGIYFQTLNSVFGCDSIITLDLVILPTPEIVANQFVEICQAEKTTLSVTSSSQFVSWYNQEIGGLPIAEGHIFETPILSNSTTYYVEAIDNNCVSSRLPITVSVNNKPSITLTSTNTNCGTNNGSASASINGGVSPYNYYWSNGDQNVFDIFGLSTGSYYFNVEDAKGCKSMAVTEIIPASVNIIPTIVNPSCFGSTNGSISINVNGFGSGLTYLWNTGASTSSINQLPSGTYEVTITNLTGCITSASFVLNAPNMITSNVSTVLPDCGLNNGAIQISNITGGNDNYLINWSNGQIGSIVSNLTFGIYTYSIVDQNGCFTTNSVFLSEKNAPIINGVVTNQECNESNGAIDLTIIPSNNDEISSIKWSNGATTEDINNLTKGNYTSIITTANSCTAVNGWKIEINKPQVQEICMVTVDSVTTTNLVVWEKSQATGISHYNIYRESNQVDDYQLIDTVNIGSLSVFNDVIASPKVRSWRYKIAAVNECGIASDLSIHHKTVHLNTFNEGVNSSKITWDKYEGNQAFSNYSLWRYTDETGWENIANLPPNVLSFTDNISFSTPGLDYMIEIQLDEVCTATVWRAQDFNVVRSNKDRGIFNAGVGTGHSNNDLININMDNFEINVFPNPFNDEVTIQIDGTNELDIQLFDLNGKLILTNKCFQGQNIIDLSQVEYGVYFVRFNKNKESKMIKIVKQ